MAKDKSKKKKASDGADDAQIEAEAKLPVPPPRMKLRFRDEVSKKIGQEFDIKNPMALPKIDKVIINVGMGNQLEGTKLNTKAREQVVSDLAVISGQKPVVIKARKSVSNFKLRAGYEVAARVTLRGDRMWEFLDRLVTLAIPRIKDFRGLPTKSFDGRGSYSFGVQEQGIFPEVNMANVEFIHGLHVNIVIKNSTDDISRKLLTELGMPFVKPESNN